MRVAWTHRALADLADIQDHVALDSPAAAYRLAIQLTKRTDDLLAENPRAGRIGRARGTRELVLADLSYIVVYRIAGSVEVLAVVHAARRWPERLA